MARVLAYVDWIRRQSDEMERPVRNVTARVHLFRWWKRTQLDIRLRRGYLSLGLDRRDGWRVIAYVSPDATPVHPSARSLGTGANHGTI